MQPARARQLDQLDELRVRVRAWIGTQCVDGASVPRTPYGVWPSEVCVATLPGGRRKKTQKHKGSALRSGVRPDDLRAVRLAWIDVEGEVGILCGAGQVANTLRALKRDVALADREKTSDEVLDVYARVGAAEGVLNCKERPRTSIAHASQAIERDLRRRNAEVDKLARASAAKLERMHRLLPAIVRGGLYDAPGNVVLARFCERLEFEGIKRSTIARITGLDTPDHLGGDPGKAARDSVGSRIRWLRGLAIKHGCPEALEA